MAAQDWFQRLTGFPESDYATTQQQLSVDGDKLISRANGKRYGIGELSLPTLSALRSRVAVPDGPRSTVRCLAGDARALHAEPALAGALFQVASQFNLLEMVSPSVSPEAGVTRYASDHTQGPACAMAAGAATVYRNYCVPVGGGIGQRTDRQLDALAPLGAALATALDRPVSALWTMQNGYALCTDAGLAAITGLLAGATEPERDAPRGQLAIGLHRGVQVTDITATTHVVSQAFCSALPVSYSPIGRQAWEAFARLVLEAAYEATLLAAVEQAAGGGSNVVLLTRLGGGAFGNDEVWIDDAIQRALPVVEHAGLDIRLVSFGVVHPSMRAIAERWG